MPNPFMKAARLVRDGPGEVKQYTTGQLMPLWRNGRPVWTDWSTEKGIKEGYKASSWYYAGINRILRAVTSVPWKAAQRKGDQYEDLPGHPLEQLIARPNPFMTRQKLFGYLIVHLYTGGNHLWSKVRARGAPVELWPIIPDGIKPVPDQAKFISKYQYDKDGVKKDFEPKDVVHFMFIDPSNPYWGMAPLKAAAMAVDTDVEAARFGKVGLQNRAVTDGVFSFAQPLTKVQWEEARQMVREQQQGADNARMPWVLGSGAQWNQMSLSPAEMDFIKSRQFTREEILSVIGVPPPMAGIYDNATLANIQTSRKIFWLDTIIPLLTDLEEAMNLGLTPEFGDDLWLYPDLSKVEAIADNFNEKVNTADKLWRMGVPFDKVNQRLDLGFDPIPGGDRAYIDTRVIPAESALDDDGLFGAGAGGDDDDDDTEA